MTFYRRNIFKSVVEHLPNPEAVFILGARQCGKTTLLRQVQAFVGEQNALYIDMEYPELLKTFGSGINEVLKYLRYHKKNISNRTYVLIDEIQHLKDFSKTIKLLVDHHAEEFKLVMTGSSSALIMYQFTESLVGRKVFLELFPLAFNEYLRFKELDRLAEAIETDISIIPLDQYALLQSLFEEYMIFGAYPKVVLASLISDKQRILLDITTSYILKDIKDLFKIEKIDQLNHLVRFLAVNIGKEIGSSSLAVETGLARDTVNTYLGVLEDSYVIKRITPFHRNSATELKKSPKFYFLDTGIRNTLITNLNELDSRSDRGELFENAVFMNLFHHLPLMSKLNYWKTRNRQEIDFVVSEAESIKAYEVKFTGGKNANFKVFKQLYPQAVCAVVSHRYVRTQFGELFGWQKLL